MGGGGLFSDGKLNFIHKLGKTDLTQFMPRSEAESLIEETEAIFDRFGMTAPVFPSDMENAKSIRKEAKKHGIDLLLIRQKHLGSDCLPNHIDGMCEALRERGVSIRTGEDVRHVIVEDGEVRGLITDKGELRCRAAILAPGRVGADWMGDMAKKYGMELQQRGIEVGVRVETHNDVMSDLTNVIYDPTFFVQTQRYDDQTRTFCTNPAGFITLENYQDFVCVNGHAYRNRKSDNTNFAFLSKVILTDPVSDSHGYGVAIGRLASLIGGGKPILQRLGDLRRGRRSTWQRIHNGYVEPTLTEVTPGDIAMALPGPHRDQPCGRAGAAQLGRAGASPTIRPCSTRRRSSSSPHRLPRPAILKHPFPTFSWRATAPACPATSCPQPPPASSLPRPL